MIKGTYSQRMGLRDDITNWFAQEIFYLEKRLNMSILLLQEKPEHDNPKTTLEKKKSKVLCVYSKTKWELSSGHLMN